MTGVARWPYALWLDLFVVLLIGYPLQAMRVRAGQKECCEGMPWPVCSGDPVRGSGKRGPHPRPSTTNLPCGSRRVKRLRAGTRRRPRDWCVGQHDGSIQCPCFVRVDPKPRGRCRPTRCATPASVTAPIRCMRTCGNGWAGMTPTTPSRPPGAAGSAGGIPTRATNASAFSGRWSAATTGLAYVANLIDAPPPTIRSRLPSFTSPPTKGLRKCVHDPYLEHLATVPRLG